MKQRAVAWKARGVGVLRVVRAKIQKTSLVETATQSYTHIDPPAAAPEPSSKASAGVSSSAGGAGGGAAAASGALVGAPGQAPGLSIRTSYTVYLMDVECAVGNESFVVATFRRYSEFREFDKLITAALPSIPPHPFPPKRIFGNEKKAFVRQRRRQLQHYLDSLLRHPRVGQHPLVLNFLCPIIEKRLTSRQPASTLLQDSIAFVLQTTTPARRLCLSLDSGPPPPVPPSLDKLPESLLVRILAHLDHRDLLAVGRASRRLYVVAAQNALWQPLLARFYPAFPAAVVNPPVYDVQANAKKQYLRLFWECKPLRRSFKQTSQFIRCNCKLFKLLGVVAGPGAQALFGLLARVSQKQRQQRLQEALARQTKEERAADANTLQRDAQCDAEYFRETATACVHVERSTAAWCYHLHEAPPPPSTERDQAAWVRALSNRRKLTAFYLLRANMCIVVFNTDEPESLAQVPAEVGRIRALCSAMPVFLVGVPTRCVQEECDESDGEDGRIKSPRKALDKARQEARLRAIEMGLRVGAIKYIELCVLSNESVSMMLAEIGCIMKRALREIPRAPSGLPPLVDSHEQSLIEVEDAAGADEEAAARTTEHSSDEDDDDEDDDDEDEQQRTKAGDDGAGDEDKKAGGNVPQGPPIDEQQSKRMAQAVLRGAREHFLLQLKQFSINGVLAEYESSTLSLDVLAAKLKVFIADMVSYVHSTSLWCNAPKRERTLVAHELEEYIFDRLYHVLFRPPQDRAQDREIERKISRLSFVMPSHLDIPRQYWDNEAWEAAAEELLNMNYCVSPCGKMHCLMNSTKIVLHSLQAHSPMRQTSADHFLPHLIYILLKANPPFLASNIAFVQRFKTENESSSEAGYYWTSMEVAVSFIQQVTSRLLHISDEEYERLTSDTLVPLRYSEDDLDALPEKPLKSLGLRRYGMLGGSASAAASTFNAGGGGKAAESPQSPSSVLAKWRRRPVLTPFHSQNNTPKLASLAASGAAHRGSGDASSPTTPKSGPSSGEEDEVSIFYRERAMSRRASVASSRNVDGLLLPDSGHGLTRAGAARAGDSDDDFDDDDDESGDEQGAANRSVPSLLRGRQAPKDLMCLPLLSNTGAVAHTKLDLESLKYYPPKRDRAQAATAATPTRRRPATSRFDLSTDPSMTAEGTPFSGDELMAGFPKKPSGQAPHAPTTTTTTTATRPTGKVDKGRTFM